MLLSPSAGYLTQTDVANNGHSWKTAFLLGKLGWTGIDQSFLSECSDTKVLLWKTRAEVLHPVFVAQLVSSRFYLSSRKNRLQKPMDLYCKN